MTMNQNDHDQIIDQVISLENDFINAPSAVDNIAVSSGGSNNMRIMNEGAMTTTTAATIQQQHVDLGNLNHPVPQLNLPVLQDQNQEQHSQEQPCPLPVNSNICDRDQQQHQLSFSSEDLLNLLLEFDKDSQNLDINIHSIDQDEKTGIETIRKQLMNYEVQSDQLQLQPHHHADGAPQVLSQMSYQPHQLQQHVPHVTQAQQHHQDIHQNHPMQHLNQAPQTISQTAPVMPNHLQHPSLTTSGLSHSQERHQLSQHHQRLSVDQSLLNGPYSASPVNFVPISSSSQSYSSQQQHQNVTRINPISIVSNSPSPSWQQNQQSLSPFSPQQNQHLQQQPSTPQQVQRHPVVAATSLHLQQQLHHSLQHQRSPSQSVSPPVTTSTLASTTEPSPVVKKNPLLNAQLVNSRAPSLTPSRFMMNQTNVLHQNPILNSKLSQSTFTSTSGGTADRSVDQNLNSETVRYMQPHVQQLAPNFNYDINQHLDTSQSASHVGMYTPGSDQQQPQIQTSSYLYGTTGGETSLTSCVASPPIVSQPVMVMSNSANVSQQVKQEIRRKVQQPKQSQQPTTSLLKQLLSDDNK